MDDYFFFLTRPNIEVDAGFLDAESGIKGSGGSKNSRLGGVSADTPNARCPALGKPWMGSVVTESVPWPPTNASRKLIVDFPGARNLSVAIFDFNTVVV